MQATTSTFILDISRFWFTVPLVWAAASMLVTSAVFALDTGADLLRHRQAAALAPVSHAAGGARMTLAVLIGGFMLLFLLGVPVSLAIGIASLLAILVGDYSLLDLPRYVMSGIELVRSARHSVFRARRQPV